MEGREVTWEDVLATGCGCTPNEIGSSYTVVGSCGSGKAIVGSTMLEPRSTGVVYVPELDACVLEGVVTEEILEDSSKALLSCSSSSLSNASASSLLISSTFSSSLRCSSVTGDETAGGEGGLSLRSKEENDGKDGLFDDMGGGLPFDEKADDTGRGE